MVKVSIQTLIMEPVKNEHGHVMSRRIIGSEIQELELWGSDYAKWLKGKYFLQENAITCPKCREWLAKSSKECMICGAEINGSS